MKAYEDHLYEQWRDNVEQVLPSLLKRNLLIKPEQQQQQQQDETNTTDGKEEQEAGQWWHLVTFIWTFMVGNILDCCWITLKICFIIRAGNI